MLRRLTILIPLVTLLLGGLLYLWHSSTPPEPGIQPPPRVNAAPLAPVTPEAPAPKLARKGALRVIVHDADGKGLPGAKVTVVHEDKPDSRMEFETEADGGRTVLGIPPGHYAVDVRHPGRITSGSHVEIAADSTCEVRVRMLRGATVRGTVLNRRGEPVAAARVSLLHAGTQRALQPDLVASSDVAGTFEIPGIPPQEIGVSVYHARYRSHVRTGIVLRSAEETQHLDLVLEDGTRVAGRVLNEAGEPIVKATLMATNEVSVATQSDAQGRFEICGLGEQPIVLAARAPGYGEQYLRRIPPGALQLEVRLPRSGFLTGKVEAVPMPTTFAVLLSYFDPELGRELKLQMLASLAPDGTFAARDIPPGTYGLEIEAPGYESLDRPQIVVQPGQVLRDIVVRLRKKS